MELREQAYVTAIARHGSLKQAAAELHISPPTLSIFLSNLEKELGLQLFDRLGGSSPRRLAGFTWKTQGICCVFRIAAGRSLETCAKAPPAP